jgi:hypothetical protein
MTVSLVFLNGSGSEIGRVVATTRGGHSFDNSNAGRAANAATGQAPNGATAMLLQVSWAGGVSGLALAGLRQAKLENLATWTPYSSEAAIRQSFDTLSTLGSQYASLSSTVSTQGVTVSQQQTAITTINNNITSLLGRYVVGVDAGGRWTGLEINGTPVAGGVKIHADYFSIEKPGGGARTEFSGGNWRVYDANGTLRVRMGVWA